MLRVMKYCIATPNRGWYLKSNRTWGGSKDFEFENEGLSDSDYAKCPDTHRSVSGWYVKLDEADVSIKKPYSEDCDSTIVQCAQDMLHLSIR